MNPEMPVPVTQTPPPIELPSDRTKIVGYCRACGKALHEGDTQVAQGTIYCKDHAPQEPPPMQAAPPPISSSPYAASYVPPVASSPYMPSPYASSPSTGQGVVNPSVSPMAAFVLGLIPGVGAIYNGQYAKGLVHAIILGVLLTLASTSIPSIPEAVAVLLVITFWVYMPFEAFHTASRRRQGQAVDEFSGLAAAGVSAKFPVGAVLLIAFGVVFLLNNLNMLDLYRILRFWPVLMIGMGVYLLWARMLGGSGSGSGSSSGGSQS